MTVDPAPTEPPAGALAADAPEGERKRPRTERGRKTMRAILDAAAREFGEKGFHDASISGITQSAGLALGSFYTNFESKDAVFRALVQEMSVQVCEHVTPAIRAASARPIARRGLHLTPRLLRRKGPRALTEPRTGGFERLLIQPRSAPRPILSS